MPLELTREAQGGGILSLVTLQLAYDNGGTISTGATDALLTIESLEKVGFWLRADTDNSGETGTPSFLFGSDGDTTETIIGHGNNGGDLNHPRTGGVETIVDGSANDFIIATVTGGEGIQLAPSKEVTIELDPRVVSILGDDGFDAGGIIYFGDQLCGLAERNDDDVSLWAIDNVEIGSDGGLISLGQLDGLLSTDTFTSITVLDTSDSTIAHNGSLSVGTSAKADAAAVVDMISTTQGVVLPRLTTVQSDAITLPPTGLLVWDTDLTCIRINFGTPAAPGWQCLGDPPVYGGFSDLSDQTFLLDTATVITLDTADEVSPGVGLTHNINGEITIDRGGVYQLTCEPQVIRNSGSNQEVIDVWLQVDTGSGFANVADSNIKRTVSPSGATGISPLTITRRFGDGDVFRFMARVSDVNIALEHTPPVVDGADSVPATPSVIVNVLRLGN